MRRWLLLAAGCVAVVCDCATLRFLWSTTELKLGQYQIGYFEEPDGVASMVLDDAQHTSVQPDVALDATGGLSIPPGRSVGLSLMDDREYRIRVDDRSWAPFCVFGKRSAVVDPSQPPASRVVDPRVLGSAGGHLVDYEWTILRPWQADQQRLEALRADCAGEVAAALIVRVRQGQVALEYGTCAHQLSGVYDVMLVLAGPSWTSVQDQAGWQSERAVQTDVLWPVMGLSLARYATAAAAFGALPAAMLAVGVLLLTTALPAAGIIAFVVLLLLGFAAAGLRILRAAASTFKVTLGYVLLLIPCVIVLSPFIPARWLPSEPMTGNAAQCVLLGYSSIRGDSLRENRGWWPAHGGAWDQVARASICAGSFERRARAAGRFSWTRDVLCSDERSVLAGGQAIFFGGSNDDFFWARFQASRVAQLARVARYAYARPDATQWRELGASVETDSLNGMGEQRQAMQEALACVVRQGARFRYFHDFLAWDLADARSDMRRQMLEERAAIVREGGGTFTDVLAGVADEVGVWWFNDYIHPSQIGHRRVGELIARQLDNPDTGK